MESLECSRFVLTDECPANAESWFLARCFDELLVRGVRGIVSFADPVPRRDAPGAVVAVGHVGTIYAAYAGADMSITPSGGCCPLGTAAGEGRHGCALLHLTV
ncbi:hypothetical protein [Streptomyces mirabilis]|uniref:hypothetical protein n=1 Tax=Streptomyces mirabilis TaxID=68239 RepID=UPI0033A61464